MSLLLIPLPGECPAPCWSELVQASVLNFHLLSVKVVLHCFAVKIKKELEGENSWLVNRAEQPKTSHPGGEEEGRDSLGEPRVGFQHSTEDKMLY